MATPIGIPVSGPALSERSMRAGEFRHYLIIRQAPEIMWAGDQKPEYQSEWPIKPVEISKIVGSS